MTKNSIFFNHSFEKKRLKALISWINKTFGEKEALRVVDELKVIGFTNATRAGLSIGLHDLVTPPEKPFLISKAQVAMNQTNQEFKGGKITATERSQRIIDTWHRTSDTLRKQVVDHFNTYDQLNSVYIMALSGARGNFAQVRQLIGMRGLMADPQGQIISFPIRSNFREGLTLTEYFISCSGARKGIVDTALRTADTGYLTRRLVDVSHQVVIKRVACHTSRGIVIKALKTGPVGGENKIMLPLKDRLIGRVLAEDIKVPNFGSSRNEPALPCQPPVGSGGWQGKAAVELGRLVDNQKLNELPDQSYNKLATRDSEISPNLAFKIACLREQVVVRSSLTCACTHEVCQLCYGWSLSQGKLVSLGEAVGVIAAQSIGEPGTQLTMRTFHTGGVFSGEILQDLRAPHAGKVFFPQALQGLLVRTAQGRIAFLIKTPGALLLDDGQSQISRIQLEAATMVFVRQGEYIEFNTILGELAVVTKEGNQPIKSRQTLFAEFGGRVTHQRGRTFKRHKPKYQEEPRRFSRNWSNDLPDIKKFFYVEENDKIVKKYVDVLGHGLRLLEPTHSLSLGVFRILAIRVGAIENHLAKVCVFREASSHKANCDGSRSGFAEFRFTQIKQNRGSSTAPADAANWPNSTAPNQPEVGKAGSARVAATKLGTSFVRRRLAAATVGKAGSNLIGRTHKKSFETRVQDVRPFLRLYKLSGIGSHKPSVLDLVTSGLSQALLDKRGTTASCFREAPTIDRFITPSYVLNTIAEEGDLVDDNYKDCTSSFT